MKQEIYTKIAETILSSEKDTYLCNFLKENVSNGATTLTYLKDIADQSFRSGDKEMLNIFGDKIVSLARHIFPEGRSVKTTQLSIESLETLLIPFFQDKEPPDQPG
jgi:hypothetical protein